MSLKSIPIIFLRGRGEISAAPIIIFQVAGKRKEQKFWNFKVKRVKIKHKLYWHQDQSLYPFWRRDHFCSPAELVSKWHWKVGCINSGILKPEEHKLLVPRSNPISTLEGLWNCIRFSEVKWMSQTAKKLWLLAIRTRFDIRAIWTLYDVPSSWFPAWVEGHPAHELTSMWFRLGGIFELPVKSIQLPQQVYAWLQYLSWSELHRGWLVCGVISTYNES